MDNPLTNPFAELVDDVGRAPGRAWRIAGVVAGIAGAIAARKFLDGLRGKARAPRGISADARNQQMGWSSALTWTAVAGVGGTIGRVAAQRLLAGAWKRTRRSS